MYNDVLQLIQRLESDMENADREAVNKEVSQQQQHYYAGKAAAFSDCIHLLTLLLGSQPKEEIEPPLHKTPVSGSLELLAQLLKEEQEANRKSETLFDKEMTSENLAAIRRVMRIISALPANDR